jgi:hypothetical protein
LYTYNSRGWAGSEASDRLDDDLAYALYVPASIALTSAYMSR